MTKLIHKGQNITYFTLERKYNISFCSKLWVNNIYFFLIKSKYSAMLNSGCHKEKGYIYVIKNTVKQ